MFCSTVNPPWSCVTCSPLQGMSSSGGLCHRTPVTGFSLLPLPWGPPLPLTSSAIHSSTTPSRRSTPQTQSLETPRRRRTTENIGVLNKIDTVRLRSTSKRPIRFVPSRLTDFYNEPDINFVNYTFLNLNRGRTTLLHLLSQLYVPGRNQVNTLLEIKNVILRLQF